MRKGKLHIGETKTMVPLLKHGTSNFYLLFIVPKVCKALRLHVSKQYRVIGMDGSMCFTYLNKEENFEL